jgi:23S rRNA pseudouridine1911/1915/1917 synthase
MVVHPAPGSPNGTFVNALIYHLGDKASNLLLDNGHTIC